MYIRLGFAPIHLRHGKGVASRDIGGPVAVEKCNENILIKKLKVYL
jgi:hypothetical protein